MISRVIFDVKSYQDMNDLDSINDVLPSLKINERIIK